VGWGWERIKKILMESETDIRKERKKERKKEGKKERGLIQKENKGGGEDDRGRVKKIRIIDIFQMIITM
jgi:hypothetical protein